MFNILSDGVPPEGRWLHAGEVQRLRTRGVSPVPRAVYVSPIGTDKQFGILSFQFAHRDLKPTKIRVSTIDSV